MCIACALQIGFSCWLNHTLERSFQPDPRYLLQFQPGFRMNDNPANFFCTKYVSGRILTRSGTSLGDHIMSMCSYEHDIENPRSCKPHTHFTVSMNKARCPVNCVTVYPPPPPLAPFFSRSHPDHATHHAIVPIRPSKLSNRHLLSHLCSISCSGPRMPGESLQDRIGTLVRLCEE